MFYATLNKMKIVFFSTNASVFSAQTFSITRTPTHATEWEQLAKNHPEHSFAIVTQLPALFLADYHADSSVTSVKGIDVVVCEKESVNEISDVIKMFKPDVAVAASFWQPPFDWHCIKDALIAQELRKAGIKTVCHSAQSMYTCFDKNEMEQFLKQNNFTIPKSVHVNHELFWSERNHKDVKVNVYKEYVLSQIEAMQYPVIIKDTVGLSSYGMEVAVSFKEAVHYLRSGKTHSDRLVQEYIQGKQFGVEVYGSQGAYTVLPPFAFSVNKFGITSPKQGIKVGPFTHDTKELKLPELHTMIQTLAQKLNLCGVAQVDVILSKDGWHVLEVNPRLSGMTKTYAASYGITVSEMLLSLATGQNAFASEPKCVCNFKLPLLTDEQKKELLSRKEVFFVRQVHNQAAKQEREKGYCEIVFGGTRDFEQLQKQLQSLAADMPSLMDEGFLQQAYEMMVTFGND